MDKFHKKPFKYSTHPYYNFCLKAGTLSIIKFCLSPQQDFIITLLL